MKRIRILVIKVAFMLIFFWNSTIIVAAINKCDSLQMPVCILNGKYHILLSSQKEYSIDVVLSKYVEQKLSIMRYDSSSFRFLVFITVELCFIRLFFRRLHRILIVFKYVFIYLCISILSLFNFLRGYSLLLRIQ